MEGVFVLLLAGEAGFGVRAEVALVFRRFQLVLLCQLLLGSPDGPVSVGGGLAADRWLAGDRARLRRLGPWASSGILPTIIGAIARTRPSWKRS